MRGKTARPVGLTIPRVAAEPRFDAIVANGPTAPQRLVLVPGRPRAPMLGRRQRHLQSISRRLQLFFLFFVFVFVF